MSKIFVSLSVPKNVYKKFACEIYRLFNYLFRTMVNILLERSKNFGV